MLKIMNKEIDLDKSAVLDDRLILGEHFDSKWNVHGGEWWVEKEWLTGKNETGSAMLLSRGDYPGDVMLECEARTVLPSTHDIDLMWNASWDKEKNERGTAYVVGIQGWWEGKAGFEKSPEYRLAATTPLFNFHPGQIYQVLVGSIEGHCFLFLDGKLIIEMKDPDPIDSQKHAKIGLEVYSSHIQIRNLKVRQIAWRSMESSYEPE
jgi:hypothetical protein